VLLLLVVGSVWLVLASLAYCLAVAAARGDRPDARRSRRRWHVRTLVDEIDAAAADSPAKPLTLAVCPTCLAVIERGAGDDACPACGDGLIASPRRSTFARIPS
jgi:hypothetical protein